MFEAHAYAGTIRKYCRVEKDRMNENKRSKHCEHLRTDRLSQCLDIIVLLLVQKRIMILIRRKREMER